MSLPDKLYRGDNDRAGKRRLRATLSHGQLDTNLIDGGDGERIFKEPVWRLINEHVLSVYERSDFLSFTADKNSAFRFGMHAQVISDEMIDQCCEYYMEQDNAWDFAILTLDTTHLRIVDRPAAGIYEARYFPTLLEFQSQGFFRIFLIDVHEALNSAGDAIYRTSIEYSRFDDEWLVLPAMPKLFNNGKVQLSAHMDAGCIDDIEKFKLDNDMLLHYNVIAYK
jgi:hypothetical protein